MRNGGKLQLYNECANLCVFVCLHSEKDSPQAGRGKQHTSEKRKQLRRSKRKKHTLVSPFGLT